MLPILLAVICAVSSNSVQSAPVPGLVGELDAIHREYRRHPGVSSLVVLDGKVRHLIEEPWKRARQSIDGRNYKSSWSAIGVNVGKYSDALEYSGKLLVEAHAMNPHSEFRRFTLFAAVMGERPSHGLGEMPDVEAAQQYSKEFPQGPFAREVAIILGDFYSDLFKVISNLQQKQARDYKYDCFSKYLQSASLRSQRARAQQLSISYYGRAFANAPAEWEETMDVRHRHATMQGGDPKSVDALGWHFCAD